MLLLEHHDVVTDELRRTGRAGGRAAAKGSPAPRARRPPDEPPDDDQPMTTDPDDPAHGADVRGDGRARRAAGTCCGPATSSCCPVRSARARPRWSAGSARPWACAGAVTSPTFVIARVHPSLTGGPGAGARRRVPARRPGRARRPRSRCRPRRVGDGGRVGHRGGGGAGRARLEVTIDRRGDDRRPSGRADGVRRRVGRPRGRLGEGRPVLIADHLRAQAEVASARWALGRSRNGSAPAAVDCSTGPAASSSTRTSGCSTRSRNSRTTLEAETDDELHGPGDALRDVEWGEEERTHARGARAARRPAARSTSGRSTSSSSARWRCSTVTSSRWRPARARRSPGRSRPPGYVLQGRRVHVMSVNDYLATRDARGWPGLRPARRDASRRSPLRRRRGAARGVRGRRALRLGHRARLRRAPRPARPRRQARPSRSRRTCCSSTRPTRCSSTRRGVPLVLAGAPSVGRQRSGAGRDRPRRCSRRRGLRGARRRPQRRADRVGRPRGRGGTRRCRSLRRGRHRPPRRRERRAARRDAGPPRRRLPRRGRGCVGWSARPAAGSTACSAGRTACRPRSRRRRAWSRARPVRSSTPPRVQALLRRYPTICGMTGTALAVAEQLAEIYGLEVAAVAPNVPCVRVDEPDRLFAIGRGARRRRGRRGARAARDRSAGPDRHARRRGVRAARPVLGEEGVECVVLNARNDAEEAAIIAEAGTYGAVTVSTQMAGRGVDIRLGGTDWSRPRARRRARRAARGRDRPLPDQPAGRPAARARRTAGRPRHLDDLREPRGPGGRPIRARRRPHVRHRRPGLDRATRPRTGWSRTPSGSPRASSSRSCATRGGTSAWPSTSARPCSSGATTCSCAGRGSGSAGRAGADAWDVAEERAR